MGAYCRDKTVLDCYSYTGGFGLYAARFGAGEVTSVESSESACSLMEKNFDLNRAKNSIVREDAEAALSQFQKENRKFDIIVLDPPALAKSKKNLFGALRKYKKLNELAMSVLSPEGILFSSSCSRHVGRKGFLEAVQSAGVSRNRRIQILEMRGASRDHPVLPSMPETEYLKCAILKAE
jgi:23S rRNA (cytosine1962-C5)-methyltransferase